MKKMKLAALALALAGIFAAGNALAAGSANLTVSATVTDACAVTGGSIAFGNLDPINDTGTKSVGSTGVTIACTSGDTYTISDNKAGSYSMSDGSGHSIPYSLSYPSVPTADGNANAYTITGSVAQTDYANSPAGSYSDTVVLTVTP